MMSNFGLCLRRLVVRWFGYALGVCAVLAILGAGVFIVTKPSLLSFIYAEVKKYGIEVESADISMLGTFTLENVRLPMQGESTLAVGRLSGRLPVPWLGGTASFHDVFLKKGDMSVAIPELYLHGVSPAEKRPPVSSQEMQLLMRINASGIEAPEIELTVDRGGRSEKVTVRRFALDGFRQGKVDSVMIGGIDSTLAFAHSSAQLSTIHSGPLVAENIDLASAYAFLNGIADSEDMNRVIAGPFALRDLTADLAGEQGENLHVAIGALNSNALSLKPAKVAPLEVIQTFLAARYSAAPAEEKKKDTLRDLLYVLKSVAAVDAEMKGVAIETPRFRTGFSYLELKPQNWNGVIPQGFIISLQDFTLDMTRMHSEYAQLLRDMGYERLDLSFLVDMFWNPADRTMALRNIAFAGKNIGEISFQGTLLNFDERFFSADSSWILAAIAGSAISELDITVADSGVIDRFIEWETTQINISRQELKDSLYEIAVKSPPLLLKNSKDTLQVSDAFGAFVRDSDILHIRMSAREKQGISLTDFTDVQNDLSILLDRIDLDVSTGKRPG